jgi:hypothetical protein
MNAEHYRRYAKACFQLANIMSDLNMKVTMIEVARGWQRLAEQNERNSAGPYDAAVPYDAECKTKRAS